MDDGTVLIWVGFASGLLSFALGLVVVVVLLAKDGDE